MGFNRRRPMWRTGRDRSQACFWLSTNSGLIGRRTQRHRLQGRRVQSRPVSSNRGRRGVLHTVSRNPGHSITASVAAKGVRTYAGTGESVSAATAVASATTTTTTTVASASTTPASASVASASARRTTTAKATATATATARGTRRQRGR